MPNELQREIAAFLVYMWPDHPLESNIASTDLPQALIQWMNRYSNDQFKATGLVLGLIKFTEFIFINQRSTDEDWDITMNRLEIFTDSVKQNGDPVLDEKLQAMLLEIPERSALWINASQAWQKLRASTLSDDALHSGLRPRAA